MHKPTVVIYPMLDTSLNLKVGSRDMVRDAEVARLSFRGPSAAPHLRLRIPTCSIFRCSCSP